MTEISINVQSTLQWTAFKSEHCERWIAECNALGIAVEGDSLDEVHSLIPEASHALLLDLFAENELDTFLEQRGWEADMPTGPNSGDIGFSVPWNLVAPGAAGGSKRSAH